MMMTYERNFLSLSNIATLRTLRKMTQIPHDVAVHQPVIAIKNVFCLASSIKVVIVCISFLFNVNMNIH